MENIEIWKEIKDYEGLYMISNLGRVKSLSKVVFMEVNNSFFNSKESILSQSKNPKGYFFTGLTDLKIRKNKTTHRLVAIAFIPNPENKPCVNHIDGDKTNNNDWNLEWCTYSENTIHAYKIGLKKAIQGSNHSRSKITDDEVLIIRDSNLTQRELSIIYKVHQTTISLIKTKKNWKHI